MTTSSFHRSFIALLIVTGSATAGLCHDFVQGIILYNHAQYDSLIDDFVPRFLESHPDEQGLAHYFMAEATYNKGLQSASGNAAATAFRAAWREFQMAAASPDLRRSFPEYASFAQYKLGWCSFRLAELDDEPEDLYRRAFNEFNDMQPEAPDSLLLFSDYMAAESLLRETSDALYALGSRNLDPELRNRVSATYKTVTELYDGMRARGRSESSAFDHSRILECVALRKAALTSVFAGYYQGLAALAPSSGESASLKQQAESVLADARFASLQKNLSQRSIFRPYLPYLKMTHHLMRYQLRKDEQAKQSFLQEWNQLRGSEFTAEKYFRIAGLNQAAFDASGYESGGQTAYYDSAAAIPESYYWLGYLQMIQGNMERTRKSLVRFLQLQQGGQRLSGRERLLVEDATYRKLLLDFEQAFLAGSAAQLRRLRNQLDEFSPESRLVRKKKEKLNILTNCGLARNNREIWDNVLHGTPEEKTAEALETIRFILPFAALNIGQVRDRYVHLLNRLFAIPQIKNSDETRFFHGIVKSLEAEIQPTPDAKIAGFEAAAGVLQTVQAEFVNRTEADYIRARCLFFADKFRRAQKALLPLINQRRSLRALFYLAEIFRLDGHGKAAQLCYDHIIRTLQNADYPYDDFWLSNAIAGIRSADDAGSTDVLEGIDVDGTDFQPGLHPDALTYEKLAEEAILRRRSVRESVEWLVLWGLPFKDFYPSTHRLRPALVAKGNYFDSFSGVLNEVRGRVTSAISLQIIVPEAVTRQPEVRLGQNALVAENRAYVHRNVPLDTVLTLTVGNPGCYEFRQPVRFARPGISDVTVRLDRKLDFTASDKALNLFDDFDYPLAPRPDDNFVFHEMPAIDPGSDMARDYAAGIEIRDLAFDRAGDRFVAINALDNSLTLYSKAGARTGVLNLAQTSGPASPEGVAVAASGMLYITDWSGHRVMQFDSSGTYRESFGSFGANSPEDIGQPAKFIFPTRLAVVDAAQESDRNELRQTYLYVADYKGIHLCKTDGTYLGTLVGAGSKEREGAFYAFLPRRSGESVTLFLVNRHSAEGKVSTFVSKQ